MRSVRSTFNINSAVPGNWDTNIVVWPWLGDMTIFNFQRFGYNSLRVPGTGGFLTPQVSFYNVPSGSSTNFNQVPTGGISANPSYHNGNTRLVGMGVEVINTTANLYRQGSVVVYRQGGAQGEPEGFQYIDATDTIRRSASAQMVRTPPTNPGAAILVPGARQWKAEDGCYFPICFSGSDNPPLQPNGILPYLNVNGSSIFTDTIMGSTMNGFTFAGPGASTVGITNKVAPINISGALFTGLSEQTTLVVNVIWYIEYFPSTADPAFLPLARPSCTKDELALALYAELVNTLPIAVPVDWNESGDWWWDVVTAIKDLAGPVLGMIGGAPGTALGEGIGAVTGILRDKYMTNSQAVVAPGQGAQRPNPRTSAKKPRANAGAKVPPKAGNNSNNQPKNKTLPKKNQKQQQRKAGR